MLRKISQSQKRKILYDDSTYKSYPRMVKFVETKWRSGCQRLEGMRNKELLFNWYRISVLPEKHILRFVAEQYEYT